MKLSDLIKALQRIEKTSGGSQKVSFGFYSDYDDELIEQKVKEVTCSHDGVVLL